MIIFCQFRDHIFQRAPGTYQKATFDFDFWFWIFNKQYSLCTAHTVNLMFDAEYRGEIRREVRQR